MRTFKTISSIVCALALTGSLISSVRSAPMLSGSVTEERVQKLTSDITWYTSLQAAEDTARTQNKLIFWVHMLGNLDGKT